MLLNRRRWLLHASATSAAIGLARIPPLALADEAVVGDGKNPFLQGNFAPVRKEITVDGLKVIGKLPAEMNGMFVRNSPNPQFQPLRNYHWFEGDGIAWRARTRRQGQLPQSLHPHRSLARGT